MHKRLIAACMALAAFAVFAIGPATASAVNNPIVTHPTGTIYCPNGGGQGEECKIKGTQVGPTTRLLTTTGGEILTCTTATMTGALTANAVGNVKGNITSAVFGGTGAQVVGEPAPECTGISSSSVTPLGLPWCLSSTGGMGEDEFQVRGSACNLAGTKIKFIINTTLVGECEYESTGVIKGTFKTDGTSGETSDAIGSVSTTSAGSGFTRIRGNVFCPSSGMLEMTFTLETDTTVGSEPIYIS